MKKTNIIYAAVALLGILATGCEVDIKTSDTDDIHELDINALLSPDTTLTVTVTKACSFKDFTIDEYIDFADYESHNYNDALVKRTVVPTAKVTATVNGSDVYDLKYDAKNFCFQCDYRPKEGDEVTIQASADGYPAVKAQTKVPQHQLIEVVGYEKFYDPMSFETDTNTAQDTVARITLRITDPANETNYYRLKVRSAALLIKIDDKEYIYDGDTYYFKDSFSSSDVIFKNVSLHKGYGGWAAGMSNVFSDNLINGKTHEFTVETRLRESRPVIDESRVGQENKWVVVELQSITPEFFNYLNSIWLYRITDRDAYTETVQIYSNVDNGWGIVGALSSEKHIIRF